MTINNPYIPIILAQEPESLTDGIKDAIDDLICEQASDLMRAIQLSEDPKDVKVFDAWYDEQYKLAANAFAYHIFGAKATVIFE